MRMACFCYKSRERVLGGVFSAVRPVLCGRAQCGLVGGRVPHKVLMVLMKMHMDRCDTNGPILVYSIEYCVCFYLVLKFRINVLYTFLKNVLLFVTSSYAVNFFSRTFCLFLLSFPRTLTFI